MRDMNMDTYTVGALVLILYCFVTVTVGQDTCNTLPAAPANDVKYLGGSSPDTGGLYAHGAVAVYKCEESGFGYISLSCLGNNVWGSQSRECEDDLDFGIGSIIGVSVFGIAVLISVVSLVASTVMKEKPATAV